MCGSINVETVVRSPTLLKIVDYYALVAPVKSGSFSCCASASWVDESGPVRFVLGGHGGGLVRVAPVVVPP